MTTIRCRCGYTLEHPHNVWEAANQTCPGCGITLDYIYDERQNEARIYQELGTACKRMYVPAGYWSFVWPSTWVMFFSAQPTSRQMFGWENATILNYFFIVLFLLAFPLFNWILGIGLVSVLYTAFTKKMYVEDRVAYARAGGLDIAVWTPVVCLVLLAAYYWATFTERLAGPVWRSPLGFFLLWVVFFVLTQMLLALIFFKLRRPKFGKRTW